MTPSDGASFAPIQRDMTGEQLTRLEQNPFWVQANEFFLDEATTLVNMLEAIGFNPATVEERENIRLQCGRMKQTRLVIQQCEELVLSGAGSRFIS